jgi:START domain
MSSEFNSMIGKGVGLILFFTTTFCYSQNNDCDLRKDSDGIKVYVCKSGHEKFKTLRAEFLLENTSMDQLLAHLFDVPNYPNWQYNMASAEMLSKISEDEMMYRSEIDAPWPLEDRELIINFNVIRDAGPNQVRIVIHNMLSDRPIPEGLIRVPFFSATYSITVVNGTSLNVIYHLKIDPGGSVPPWLVNIAMAEGPYISFKNLKKRISEVDSTKN